MKWYLAVLKKYAVFKGRAAPVEYWMFVVFNLIFFFATYAIDYILGRIWGDSGYVFAVFNSLYTLAVFIPGLAVLVRRLHDVGESGWFLLINLFLPLIGSIWTLVLTVKESEPEENEYGPVPIDA